MRRPAASGSDRRHLGVTIALALTALALSCGGVSCLLTNSLEGVSDLPPDDPDTGSASDVHLRDASVSLDALFPLDDGSVPCGQDGQPCCVGPLCAPGMECRADACLPPDPCGDDGQKCCTGGSCRSGFDCRDGKTCQKSPDPPPICGHSGEPCCGSGAACLDGSLVCNGAQCVVCGANAQPCCADGCHAGGVVCNGTSCIPCGGSGQPCCGGACGGGLICNGPSCIPCGGVLQPCCPGGGCTGGSTCIGSTCKECCALCKNRSEYHYVAATADCAGAAKTYCDTPATPTRGVLTDAMWGSCP